MFFVPVVFISAHMLLQSVCNSVISEFIKSLANAMNTPPWFLLFGDLTFIEWRNSCYSSNFFYLVLEALRMNYLFP